MTTGIPSATPGDWNELLRVAAEDGLSPASLPAYLLIGEDGDTLSLLASALSPSAHCVGTAANGMSFLVAADAMFVTVPLRAAGDREACLPSQRWLSTRPDAPLNGVIWLFTAADAWRGKSESGGVAAPYWKMSLMACRRCGVDLPLYAMAMGDDGIPGFTEFASFFQEEDALGGVVGWAADSGIGDDRGWDDPTPGIEAMEARLRQWRDYMLSRTVMPAGMDRNAAFLLPWRAGRTVSRLAEIIADVAPSRNNAPAVTLRGIYLVALPGKNRPEATLSGNAPDASDDDDIDTLRASPRNDDVPSRVAFARGMFRERILPERWLASEPAERARRRSIWTKRLAVITALLLIVAVAVRLTIEWGLSSITDAPAAVLADVNSYRRWLRGGAKGDAPVLAGMDPPPPIVFGSASPVLPELPTLYQEMLTPSLPLLNNPSLPWRILFRIGPREASDGIGLASWLSGPPVLALADEQIAAPLAGALEHLTAHSASRFTAVLTPEEFNLRHGSDEPPVDWSGIEAGAFKSGEDAVFLDADEWQENAHSLGLWLRERRGLLSGGTEFEGLPDRFARKRFLDSYRRAVGVADKIYRHWPTNSDLSEYFTSNPDVEADGLWRSMSMSGIAGKGDLRPEELSLITDWLERPPKALTPDALIAEWRRVADAWRDNPESPLFTTARTIWRRAAIAGLIDWLADLPDQESDLREAANALPPPSSPLPRIPLCALSQASFDPVWGFRPEIWRGGSIARIVAILADAPRVLSELEAADLLERDAALYLSRLRLEPARAALLAHARAYCDYWVTDMAMLANPVHWIVDGGIEREAFWTDGVGSSTAIGQEAYAVHGMNWADFQAAAARIDPRDLTRRMLSDLTQRRIEALSSMTTVMTALEGVDDGLKTRVELALAAMAEDAKLFATPEYWQAVIATWRSWRGLGNDAGRALARMHRTLSSQGAESSLMATFFPVLTANYYAPEMGEPVRLEYWRGFVRTAVELLQSETRRERRQGQKNILLKADGFPWRRDASGGGVPATREEMRTLLGRIGFARQASSDAEQPLSELPDDPELQAAVRELMGGLGLGADWLPPLNRALDERLLRLLSAFDALEEWEDDGGVPLVILPGRLQPDPRHRFFRAFSMRQESRPAMTERSAPREWERAYETAQARWAWRIPEQEQMRLRLGGAAVFDFYNQTVPVPEARIGQARLGDDVWPVLSLLLGKEAQARPCPEARVEGAEDGARVWMARLPVRGMRGGQPIWWQFGFALPTAFGPETPGGVTLLDEWPTLMEWREAVAEWNEFVDKDRALRVAAAGEKWVLRSDPAASVIFQSGDPESADPDCDLPELPYND